MYIFSVKVSESRGNVFDPNTDTTNFSQTGNFIKQTRAQTSRTEQTKSETRKAKIRQVQKKNWHNSKPWKAVEEKETKAHQGTQ